MNLSILGGFSDVVKCKMDKGAYPTRGLSGLHEG